MTGEDAATRPHGARRIARVEIACLAVAVAGFVVRAFLVLAPDINWDGAWYLLLARSFAEHGRFSVPWDAQPYDGYWPPLYPIYLAAFVKAFGPSFRVESIAASVASLLACIVAYVTTRDLVGRRSAAVAAAFVACDPILLVSDARGMSESLILVPFIVAAWALLKSAREPRWVLVAAVAGGVAYLGKANVGLPFAIGAGVLLVAWLATGDRARAALRSPVVRALALVLVAAAVLLALLRPQGWGSVGMGVMEPVRALVAHPTWPLVLVGKLLIALAFLAVVTLPFTLDVRGAGRGWDRRERVALLAMVGGVAMLEALFATGFYFSESRDLLEMDNFRYLVPAIVPALWLFMRGSDLEAPPEAPRAAWDAPRVAFALAAGAMVALLFVSPLLAPTSTIEAIHTRGRLGALVLLALVPLALAVAATRLSTRPALHEARRKKVRGSPKYLRPSTILLLAGASAALAFALIAWYRGVGLWFPMVGLGAAVALGSTTISHRAVLLPLVVLAVSAPMIHPLLPIEDVASATAAFPEGSKVGTTPPAVYYAAVAPPQVQPVLVEGGVPPDLHALVLWASEDQGSVPGLTRIAGWDQDVYLFPTIRLELAIERATGANAPDPLGSPILALFVANASASSPP